MSDVGFADVLFGRRSFVIKQNLDFGIADLRILKLIKLIGLRQIRHP